MAATDPVVIDTSAFFALVAENDRYHDEASVVFWSLAGEERALITTSYALVETHALVARRLGFEKVRQLVASLTGAVEIVWVGREMHDWAWERMEERDGMGLSLVDWTLAWIAERENASILTFDGDFASEGLSVLPGVP